MTSAALAAPRRSGDRVEAALQAIRVDDCAACRGRGYFPDAPVAPPNFELCPECKGDGRAFLDDPAEAWEALATAGLISHDWVDDPRRRFVGRVYVPARFGTGPGGAYEDLLRAHPATAADCAAFASDAPSVLAAEELARHYSGGRTQVAWRGQLALPGSRIGPAPSRYLALAGVRDRVRRGVSRVEFEVLFVSPTLARTSFRAQTNRSRNGVDVYVAEGWRLVAWGPARNMSWWEVRRSKRHPLGDSYTAPVQPAALLDLGYGLGEPGSGDAIELLHHPAPLSP